MSIEELFSSIKSLIYHDKLILMECLTEGISEDDRLLEEKKRKFFEHVAQNRFSLPSDYHFDREELYAKNSN